MTTEGDVNAHPEQLPMVPDRIRQATANELGRLERFVTAFPAEAWTKPSAAAGWSVGDVIAHLNLAFGVYNRVLSAIAGGKGSGGLWKTFGQVTKSVGPAMAPAFHAMNSAIPKLVDLTLTPQAIRSQFATGATTLRTRLDNLEGGDYSREVYYVGGPWPLAFFLAAILDELAIHGWDMASTFDPQARLSDDARTVLPWFYWSGTPFMLRPPASTKGTVAVRLSDPEIEMWWTISGTGITNGMGAEVQADSTINSESGTFVLALAGRVKPLEALRFGALEVQGNEDLARTFLSSWRIV